MKRGIGFGKIGLNLGQMKIAEKDESNVKDKEVEDSGGGFGSFGSFASNKKENQITNLVNEEEEAKDESEFVEDVNPDIAAVMGFSDFSSTDRKSTRLNSSHSQQSRMPSSA